MRTLAALGALSTVFVVAMVTSISGSEPPRRTTTPDTTATPRAVVVGTIHDSHLTTPGYALGVLSEIVDAYRPDLILLEIRPEAFAKGQYEEGPLEMTYIASVAASAGIPAEGIDWWHEGWWLADTVRDPLAELDAEARSRFQEEYGIPAQGLYQSVDFASVNGAEANQLMSLMLNIQDRYFGGQAEWHERQAWMHHHARLAITRHDAKRVAVFVGALHRPELVAFLRATGLSIDEPGVLIANAAEKNVEVPESAVQAWREGVGRLRQKAANGNARLQRFYSARARLMEAAIRVRGRCCIEKAGG